MKGSKNKKHLSVVIKHLGEERRQVSKSMAVHAAQQESS